MWPVVLRNAASGYLRVLISVVVGFLLTPLMVRELGVADYGLWVLVLAISAYFISLDLGLKRALVHETAVHRARGEENVIRETTGPFFVIFVAVGILIFLLTLLIVALLPHMFNLAPGSVGTGRFLLLVIGGTWALQFPSNAAVGVLLGYERYYGINVIGVASRVAQGAASAVVLLAGGGVEALALVLAGTEATRAVADTVLAYRVIPGFGISLRNADWAHLRGALNRSMSFFLNSSNGILTSRADEIMIGAFLTVSSVGVYGVGLRVVNLTRTFASQLDEVLMPVLSRLTDTKQGRRELGPVMLKATRVTAGIATGITLPLVVFGRPFLDLWIGSEVEDAYYPLVILAVMSYFALIQSLNVRILLASDLHRVTSLLTLATMVLNVVASLILIQQFELIGVAAGSLIAISAPAFIRIPMGCRIAGLSPWRFVVSGLMPSLAPAILAGAVGFGLQEVWRVSSWPLLLAEGGVVLLVYGVPLVLLSFPIRRTWDLLSETFDLTFRSQPIASASVASLKE